MAIHVPIPTPFGVPATYWRVQHQVNDFLADSVAVFLAGYANAEARADDKQPMMFLQDVRLPGLKASTEPRRAELYEALVAFAATLEADHPQAAIIPFATGEAA